MPWLQLHLEIPASASERFETLLEQAGATAITLRDAADQPLFEPPPGATPLWDHMVLTALLPADREVAPLLEQLRGESGLDELPPYRCEILEDRAWEREWLRDFKPMRFGRRLWICPHGQRCGEQGDIVLHLDPGLAFGTGTHPTTALCLEHLESRDLAGKTVIDFGCGSGILGLAAALLGASAVWATDNDPQALLAAESNRELAGVSAERFHVAGPGALPAIGADLVLANILAGTLVELAPVLIALTAPGGELALSGILAEQVDAVCAAYSGFDDAPRVVERDGWTLITLGPRKEPETTL